MNEVEITRLEKSVRNKKWLIALLRESAENVNNDYAIYLEYKKVQKNLIANAVKKKYF